MNPSLEQLLSAKGDDVDFQELSQLRELKKLLDRQAELKKLNGLAAYVPHEKQIAFHIADKKRRYLRTGNRFGKSTCGAAEDLSWCLGERLFFPEGDPRRTVGIPQRAVKGCLIVNDWDKAAEIFTSQEDGPGRGKIFQMLPVSAERGVEKSKGGDICKILIESKWGGISSLYIDTVRSFMANPQGHESSHWDFVHIDEPCPEAMWAAYARGLMDTGGSAWFCCTPIVEMWINDYFIPKSRIRSDFENGATFENAGLRYIDKWIMTGSTRDNTFLKEEDVQTFENDVPEDERESRLEGKPRALSGMIHRSYDREKHLYSATPYGWDGPQCPPRDWTIRTSIDPHPKIPMTSLVAATGPLGHTYIWAELHLSMFVKDFAKQIVSIWDGRESVINPCDPLAWTPNPISGQTMADEFFEHGVPVSPGSKELMQGILKTGALFRARDTHGNAMIQIHESCENLLYELDRYVWDQHKEKPNANCPDHSIECLHRLVLAGLTWINPRAERIIQPISLDAMASLDLPDLDHRVKPRDYRSREAYYPEVDWSIPRYN